jgi:hypothetical protein
VPPAELSTDSFEDPDRLEPDTAMKGNAGIIGQGNPRVRVAKASLCQLFKELYVERSTNPSAVMVWVYIRRYFDRPTISRALAMAGAAGITDTMAIQFGDQPAPSGHSLFNPPGEFLGCGDHSLK